MLKSLLRQDKTANKIKKLKKKARELYIAYYAIADLYSCGLHLAENISPDLRHNKYEFNKVMDELTELDPATPDFRL